MKVKKNEFVVQKGEDCFILTVNFDSTFSPHFAIDVAISKYNPNRKIFKKTYLESEKYWFDEKFDGLTIEESAKFIFESWYAEYSAYYERMKKIEAFKRG